MNSHHVLTCQCFTFHLPRALPRQSTNAFRTHRPRLATRSYATGIHASGGSEGGSDGPSPPSAAQALPGQSRRTLLLSTAAVIAGGLLPGSAPLQSAAAAGCSLDCSMFRSPQPYTGEVRAAVSKALKDKLPISKAPVMLRLVFHDAATYDKHAGDGGADASVGFELDRPENKGLKRGWRVIEEVQSAIRGTAAEGQISTADLIVLAGAYAVAVTGGPDIDIAIGRRDATKAGPSGRLPAEDMAADVQRASFAAKSISVREMVALLGAHTLGNKGFGDPVIFDNAYYTALLAKPWAGAPKDSMPSMIGLPSDKVIADDPECLPIIREYAEDQEKFFREFAQAYNKLANLGVTWT